MSDIPERPRPGNIMAQPVEERKPVVNKPTSAPENLVAVKKPAKKQEEKGKVVFKGFTHQLKTTAKVAVFLPVSNVEVRVSPITYDEEITMAQVIVNPTDVLMEVVKIVFNHIVEGPEELTKSFDSFIDNLVEPDLSALLYGLYLCSYGSALELKEPLVCKSCGCKHEVKELNLAKIYNEVSFEGKPFESAKCRTSIDMSEYGLAGVKFNIKMPVLRKTLDNDEDDIKSISISKIEKYLENVTIMNENGVEETFTDNESLYNAVSTLPPSARRKLINILEENYFKYGITFKYSWKCHNVVDDEKALGGRRKCETENEYTPTVEQEFFRQVYDALYGTR